MGTRRKSGGMLSRLLCGGGSAIPLDEQNDFNPYQKAQVIVITVSAPKTALNQWITKKFPGKKVMCINGTTGQVQLTAMHKDCMTAEALLFLCHRKDLQYGFHHLLAYNQSNAKVWEVLDGKTLLLSLDTRNQLTPLGDYALDDEITLQHMGLPYNIHFDTSDFPGSDDLKAWLAFCFKASGENEVAPGGPPVDNDPLPAYGPDKTLSPTRQNYSGKYFRYTSVGSPEEVSNYPKASNHTKVLDGKKLQKRQLKTTNGENVGVGKHKYLDTNQTVVLEESTV